jgi:hypothetical protein
MGFSRAFRLHYPGPLPSTPTDSIEESGVRRRLFVQHRAGGRCLVLDECAPPLTLSPLQAAREFEGGAVATHKRIDIYGCLGLLAIPTGKTDRRTHP